MLPFVFADETNLGPFHPFGIMVALAFFAWEPLFAARAKRAGVGDANALLVWTLVGGTFFAWLIDAVFYHPADRSVVSSLFAFQGLSATGGYVGALLGSGVGWRYLFVGKVDGKWVMRRREEPASLLLAGDLFCGTWPVAAAIGRLGCALIHDHPGVAVAKGSLASLLALAWPRGPEDGIDHALGPLHVVTGGSDARFDLGLLEAMVLGAIALFFATQWKKERRVGFYVIVGTIAYGVARFLLDFLRMQDGAGGDLRHGGLTFAQYCGPGIAVFGAGLYVRLRGRAAQPAPRDDASNAEAA